jgi:glycosyltransferase involved in cell wall biosynthesis
MHKKKKIIHFHPNGEMAYNFVKPLIEAERSVGYSSSIVVSVNSIDVDALLIQYDINLKKLHFCIVAFFQIYKLLLRERPDIVVSHNSKSSSLVLICAWLANVPQRIYFNHGVPYIAYKGPIRCILKFFELLNLFFSTRVLTVSKDMLNVLRRLDSRKVMQIINEGSACGLNLSQYGLKKNCLSTFRLEHNISTDDFLIVFIGRPEKRKGFNLTLQMWVKFFSDCHYKLVLCGPTESDVINTLSFLPHNVICLGFTNRVPEILSQSDLLILPSSHEGLPYAILEAMASGCLVVANNIDGVKNLVTSGVNGFLVESGDEKKYAEVIHSIQCKPKFYKKLIRSNALLTVRKFSRKYFIPCYLEYLN